MWITLNDGVKEIKIEVNDPEKAEVIIDNFLNDVDKKEFTK